MTKLINGKTNENMLNIIETRSYSEPELVVPNSFTALHVAAICWELYSNTAPTHFSNEFTICEGGDFGAYNIQDSYDMAEHYFETAFSIGNSVKNDMQYSVQSAYEDAIGISADTCVRESVMSDVLIAIENCSVDDESIAEDYLILGEEAGLGAAKRIAKLEAELADLKAS